MAENNEIMDKIVKNIGKDFDYQTRIKLRKKMKEAPDQDAVDVFDEAEKDAMKEVRKKYGFKKGGSVCKLATKGKGRAYGKNS